MKRRELLKKILVTKFWDSTVFLFFGLFFYVLGINGIFLSVNMDNVFGCAFAILLGILFVSLGQRWWK